MTLGLIRLDLHFIEKSVNDKDVHYIYIAKGANNAIRYTLARLTDELKVNTTIEMCKNLLPSSIIKADKELLDLAYYNRFEDVNITEEAILKIKEDLISWFNKELNSADYSAREEVKQAEEWIEESGDII